jgi:hypothetical protein
MVKKHVIEIAKDMFEERAINIPINTILYSTTISYAKHRGGFNFVSNERTKNFRISIVKLGKFLSLSRL